MGAPEAIPLALIVAAVFQLATAPAANWVTRRMEAEADWKALEVSRDPDSVEGAMIGLSETSLGDPDPPAGCSSCSERIPHSPTASRWRTHGRPEVAAEMFPATEPYDSGLLDVGDGHEVYWECCGNRDGRPLVYLHGGPGSGATPGQRRFFDPALYRAVLFDQRGSGRSRPLASEPDADLSANTTAHLVADIERLRELHGIENWTVFGLSWGTTLGLAYAQAHPRRVDALVLGLVTTTSRREVAWITHDVGRIFPEEWERFAAAVPERCGTSRS